MTFVSCDGLAQVSLDLGPKRPPLGGRQKRRSGPGGETRLVTDLVGGDVADARKDALIHQCGFQFLPIPKVLLKHGDFWKSVERIGAQPVYAHLALDVFERAPMPLGESPGVREVDADSRLKTPGGPGEPGRSGTAICPGESSRHSKVNSERGLAGVIPEQDLADPSETPWIASNQSFFCFSALGLGEERRIGERDLGDGVRKNPVVDQASPDFDFGELRHSSLSVCHGGWIRRVAHTSGSG